jgi:electron transfer flavoprotein beta subunit
VKIAEKIMKILVCVKQVPDMDSRFRPNAAGVWFDEADLAWRMNEYDEYAVEQAILLKEQLGEAPEVTVLSIGPVRAVDVIRKALALGCDRGVHILDP